MEESIPGKDSAPGPIITILHYPIITFSLKRGPSLLLATRYLPILIPLRKALLLLFSAVKEAREKLLD